ncbi:MAG TPA: GAF domain-containing protein [Anaerolineae bacterium]
MNEATRVFLSKRQLTLWLRWIGIIAITVALGILRFFYYFDEKPVIVLLATAFVLLGLVTLFYVVARRNPSPRLGLLRFLLHFQVIFELTLLAAATNLTGGVESPVLPVFILYILVDGLENSMLAMILHAAYAVLVVALVVVGNYFDLIPYEPLGPPSISGNYKDLNFVLGHGAFSLTLFVLSVIISIAITRQFTRRERELADFAETLGARVNELDTLRELGASFTTLYEIPELLARICDGAMKLLSAGDVHIFLYDAALNEFTQGAAVWADGRRELVVAKPRKEGGLSAQVVSTGQPVVIDNAREHTFFESMLSRNWNLASIAGFPLKRGDSVLAVLNVAFFESHHFTSEEIRVLSALSDEAALAIENAQLYAQLGKRLQELVALNQIGSAVVRLSEAPTVWNEALGIISEAIKCDVALLSRVDYNRGEVPITAHRGLSAAAYVEIMARPLKIGEGISGTVAETGEPLVLRDVGDDPRVTRTYIDQEGLHSLICVPLKTPEHVVGTMTLLWKETREFSLAEINLISAIGQQVAIGLQNLDLYEETRRRAEEMSFLRAIGLAINSTLQLRDQLRLLYEKVNQLLHPEIFMVALFDERRQVISTEFIVEEGWFLRGPTVPFEEGGLAMWVIKNQKPLRVADLLAPDADLPVPARSQMRPARAWLGVPLILQDRAIGVLSVQSFKPDAFSPEDERFLLALAQHAALAVESARLYAEAERRARELSLINEIGRAISASLDLREILQRTVRSLADLLGYQMVGVFILRGERFFLEASTGYQNPPSEVPLNRGVIGRVIRTQQPAFVNDVSTDPDYFPAVPGVTSQIAVPIIGEGRALGVLSVEDQRVGNLSDQDLALINLLAQQIGVAVLNAESYEAALSRERFATMVGRAGIALGSTLELARVGDLICTEGTAVMQTSGATLFLADEDELTWQAGSGERSQELRGTRLARSDFQTLLARALQQERGLYLNDAEDFPIVNQLWRVPAALAIPLLKEKQVIGGIIFHHTAPGRRFSAEDLTRASVFGAQAALAISNAQLYERLRARAQQDASLYEVALALGARHDLTEQLEIVYHQVEQQLRPNTFYVALTRDNSDEFHYPIFVSEGKAQAPFIRARADAGITAWILANRQTLVMEDIAQELPRLGIAPGKGANPPRNASYFGAPLSVQGQVIGILAVERFPSQPFTDEEVSFLKALTREVAISLETSRLLEQLRKQVLELQHTQQRLVESERRAAMGQLAAGIAHEINNPLTAIMGHSQLLMQSEMLPHEMTEEMQVISRAARRIARITEVFLRFSRPGEMSDELLDLRLVLQRALKSPAIQASETKVQLESTYPEKPVPVRGNSSLLYQAVLNILSNAVESMPNGGTLTVALDSNGDRVVECRFEDSGRGIEPQDLPHVFEPGFTTKIEDGTVRGLGLGLYAAQQIIQSHNGTIQLASQIGKGTEVTIALPRADETVEPAG